MGLLSKKDEAEQWRSTAYFDVKLLMAEIIKPSPQSNS
ncbi:hypothetical protein DGo_PA0348 (plasmid) [Deinococcus gobiensis I-0]|uniref:Uncharacterized protein n=1 Tax=Deinococcus gobiensis (strain DSM 21396 / JCM 16679 / CGMCC 1.7299 / I-0) TaxID=745776 RepID=H8H0I2_DEIGI|nr:hypothetical protein DGo_PA0348 [Deinococcus gobiensis I-0]